jgi:hypothetical protein
LQLPVMVLRLLGNTCVCHFLAAAFSAALMSAVCLFAMDGIFVLDDDDRLTLTL